MLTCCASFFSVPTLEPEFAEETYVELTETEIETEDSATCDPSSTYSGKGVYISFFIALSLLA